MNLEKLAVVDPEVNAAIGEELGRQRNKIELIASENFVSPAVMEAMGTVLNMPRGIRDTVIMAAVNMSIRWKYWRSSALKNYSAPIMSMCSLIPALTPTLPFILLS